MWYNGGMKKLIIIPFILTSVFLLFSIFNSDYFYIEWAVPGFIMIALLLYISWKIWNNSFSMPRNNILANLLQLQVWIMGLFFVNVLVGIMGWLGPFYTIKPAIQMLYWKPAGLIIDFLGIDGGGLGPSGEAMAVIFIYWYLLSYPLYFILKRLKKKS